MLRALIPAQQLLATPCEAQTSDDVLRIRGAEMWGVYGVHSIADGNLVVSDGDAIRIRDASTGLPVVVWREAGSAGTYVVTGGTSDSHASKVIIVSH